MKRVVIESPLSPSNGLSFEANIAYAKVCGLDCIRRGEAPYASHLLMTQFLDDAVPEDRKVGMEAGFAWGTAGELVAVYEDHGVSSGMLAGIELAKERGQTIERRKLPPDLYEVFQKRLLRPTEGMK